MRRGLHYVRSCDLRTKRCTGAPASQAATQAIADALAGGPLTRRKVHAFAKHPSGSRPKAREPASLATSSSWTPVCRGRLVRPPQAQEQDSAPEPEDPIAHHADGSACPAQDGSHGEPGTDTWNPDPDVAQEQKRRRGDHECGRDGKPQDSRAFLGLGPGRAEPGSLTGAANGAGGAGKPLRPKAKRTPGGPAGQRARKPRALPEPSGNPKRHIQRWLTRGVTGESTSPEGIPVWPGGPQDQSPGNCRPESGCGMGLQPGSGRLRGAPGSSTDPPPRLPLDGSAWDPDPHPWWSGHGPRGPAGSRARLPRLGPERPAAPRE